MIPYLRYGLCAGVNEDIFNPARTLTYLAACQENGSACHIPLRVSTDLSCLCPALLIDPVDETSPVTFTNPITDGVLWYDPAQPGSDEFLGFVIQEVTDVLDAPYSRNPQNGFGFGTGGALGPMSTTMREMGIKVWLFACSDCGMEYGKRFLTNFLHSDACNTGACTSCDVEIRTCCPPADNFDVGRWKMYNVGLVDGPRFSSINRKFDCYVQQATFTIRAEYPALFKCIETCLPETRMDIVSDSCPTFWDWSTLCCRIEEPSKIGYTGAIIKIQNYDTKDSPDLKITARRDVYGTCGVDPAETEFTECDGLDTAKEEWCVNLNIKPLPERSTLTIDSVRREVYIELLGGEIVEGFSYISSPTDEPFNWIAVSCGAICLCVHQPTPCQSDLVSVKIDTVHYEF